MLRLNYCFSQSNDFQKAEDALVHVSKYHWLARYKHNDSRDLLTSKGYQADDDGAMHKFDKNYYKKEGKLKKNKYICWIKQTIILTIPCLIIIVIKR